MIHVLAIIKTKPGKRAEVLSAFAEIVPLVLEERGCIEYDATTDATNAPNIQTPFGSDTFVVIEKWSSTETLADHGQSSHMVAYGESVKHLIDQRTIYVLEPTK